MLVDVEFIHTHEQIYEDNIGVYCAEMEAANEYKLLDNEYRKNTKYKLIK